MTQSPMPAAFSIEEQISCVSREIALREQVYPRWVANQKISKHRADREIACMRAVLQSLKRMTSQ
jgi:hypothetical protein